MDNHPEIPTASQPDTPAKGNGKVRAITLDHLDGRTLAARRARELIAALEADLGGADHMSQGQRQLVQRAAVLGTMIETSEAEWLGTGKIALTDYVTALNAQRRILDTLGLERRSKDVTPDLSSYLKG